MSIAELVKDADGFLREAGVELKQGIENDDRVTMRDAAEKAWNAVVQVTNALAQKYLGRTPRSHYERRNMLKVLEEKYAEVERLGLYDRYAARSKHLHGETFYEGAIDIELLRLEIEKTGKYVGDIRRLLEPEESV